MQAYFAEGVEIDRCPFCGGLWFDGGELEQVLQHPLPTEPLGGTTPRRCVFCRTTLETGRLHGVALETCASCRSIYLDDGELAQLAKRNLTLQRVSALSGKDPDLEVRCPGCGDHVALDEAITTARGLACRNCYGMLDQAPNMLSPVGYRSHLPTEIAAEAPGAIGQLLYLVWRLFSAPYR